MRNAGQHLPYIVGFALNGVPFYSGTSEFGFDVYRPKNYDGRIFPYKQDFDRCLGSSELSDTYHYYSFSPCILNSSVGNNPALCSDVSGCKSNPMSYWNKFLTTN